MPQDLPHSTLYTKDDDGHFLKHVYDQIQLEGTPKISFDSLLLLWKCRFDAKMVTAGVSSDLISGNFNEPSETHQGCVIWLEDQRLAHISGKHKDEFAKFGWECQPGIQHGMAAVDGRMQFNKKKDSRLFGLVTREGGKKKVVVALAIANNGFVLSAYPMGLKSFREVCKRDKIVVHQSFEGEDSDDEYHNEADDVQYLAQNAAENRDEDRQNSREPEADEPATGTQDAHSEEALQAISDACYREDAERLASQASVQAKRRRLPWDRRVDRSMKFLSMRSRQESCDTWVLVSSCIYHEFMVAEPSCLDFERIHARSFGQLISGFERAEMEQYETDVYCLTHSDVPAGWSAASFDAWIELRSPLLAYRLSCVTGLRAFFDHSHHMVEARGASLRVFLPRLLDALELALNTDADANADADETRTESQSLSKDLMSALNLSSSHRGSSSRPGSANNSPPRSRSRGSRRPRTALETGAGDADTRPQRRARVQ
jgi:hypothetical protein